MATHFEESTQRDLDRIRLKVTEMSGLAERALRECLQALQERNRQLAYTVILRDSRIDELEKEIDRLCLEFLVRRQPVAAPLRFVYATIRINLELERIGDYAENMARQILKLIALDVHVPLQRFAQIANLSIPMLNDAVRAFVNQNADLARTTMEVEDVVDTLRTQIDAELLRLKLPFEHLSPLTTIVRRFERVSDQAKNICEEVLYVCTGEYSKHKGGEVYRILFLDEHNSCRSLIAEIVGNAFNHPRFIFGSAGLDPQSVPDSMVSFLKRKGFDSSRHVPKTLEQVPNLEHYQIVIGLAKSAQKALPTPPRKTIYLDWTVDDPCAPTEKSAPETEAGYEKAYQTIQAHLRDLIEAILGEKIQ